MYLFVYSYIQCPDFFSLSLAAIIEVLPLVSCDHMTKFDFDRKKERNVGLTSKFHISSLMCDSIFHETRGLRISFYGGNTSRNGKR